MSSPAATPVSPAAPVDTGPRLRLDYLDGVRALAALWVVVFHAYWGQDAQPGLAGWATNALLHSHLAVDVFIVLSGFCLALPVARTGELKGGAIPFFLRRAGPTAMLALAAVAVLYTALLSGAMPAMPLELTCPWYVLLFGMGVCGGRVALRPGQRDRLIPWAIGVSAALLATLLWRFPIVHRDTDAFNAHLPWIDAAAGALTAVLLLALSRRAARGGAFWPLALLSWRPLVLVGTFAYSLYLTHFPLVSLLVRFLDRARPPAGWHALALELLALPISLGFAYVFFLLCERPFLDTRRRETMAETARRRPVPRAMTDSPDRKFCP